MQARQGIIVVGDPVTGIYFVGPFPSEADAREFAEKDRYIRRGTWWVAPMEEPAAPEPEVTPEGITEMRLCEGGRIALKPDVTYRFTVDPDCEVCKRLAAHATQPTPGSDADNPER